MLCQLCTNCLLDPTHFIDVYSTEGRELQIPEKIKKHLPILEIDHSDKHSYTVCRDCCQILCSFHELYTFVDINQNATKNCSSDSIASQTPLVSNVCKDECQAAELEPKFHNCTNIAIDQKAEIRNNRRSQRLNAKKIDTSPSNKSYSESIETPLPFENQFIVKDEIFDNELEIDALNIDDVDEPANAKVGKTKISQYKRPNSNANTAKSKTIKNDIDEFLANNFELTCCICHIPLSDFSTLRKHFQVAHKTRGYVRCCGKKLLKRCLLVDHVQTHINPEYFKCSICGKVAANRQCLEMHLKSHEKKHERSFQCETCLKQFFTRAVLMRHLLIHIPEEEKKTQCPQCEKTFPTFSSMNQHLKIVHLNLHSKVCDICGKSIKGSETFRQHQQEHAGIPKLSVECKICGSKLRNNSSLVRHMKNVHSEENAVPQICTICSKISPTISSHRQHMNYVHNKKRKFACPMCDKAFKRANGLKEHMTTHIGGEALYNCPHCSKTFNSNSNMHSHRKKVHRKEWEETRLQRRGYNQNEQQNIE